MKKIVMSLGFIIVSQMAVAQWRFTVSLSTSGCGNSMDEKIAWKAAEAQVNYWMGEGYVTFQSKSECEQSRMFVMSQSFNQGNCKIRYIASPCTGSGGASGSVDVLGISKGSSFYSTNSVNEIKDWSEDDMERQLALNPGNNSSTPEEISMGDEREDLLRKQFRKTTSFTIDPQKPFVPINMREGGSSTIISEDLIPPKVIPADERMVSMYLENVKKESAPVAVNTDNYIAWIKEQFEMVSGYDIDDILKTIGRTTQQNEVLRNYREFEKRLLDEAKKQLDKYLNPIEKSQEKKEVDMAILAFDSYGKDENGYIFKTDYKRVEFNKIALNDPIRELANKLTSCNLTSFETGFNAVLYHNDKTNEYTIAFEGSAFPSFGKSSEITTASKIAPSLDFDMNSKEYVVNALGIEMRIPQDLWNDWGKNNALQAAGRIASQFQMAKEIADIINASPELKNMNINFTGHSLGGGLASVAGLSTGKPTYTYNAEGVSDKILDNFGLLEKKNNKDYNITAYHTDNDILTNTQKWAQGEGKKSTTELLSEQTQEIAVRKNLSQLEQMGYDTKTAKTIADIALDSNGPDSNVFAQVLDPDNKENDYGATAIGNEVNIGDINTPKDKLISGGAGVVLGISTFLITGDLAYTLKNRKKAAELTDGALAHRMEPFVKNMILKNVVQQNLWDRFNKEKQSMDRQIGNTEMRSLEQIYIVTD